MSHETLFQIGKLHYVLVHFPIALIIVAVLAELLDLCYRNPLLDYSARFMLICAAISTVPTAFFGVILSYTFNFQGSELTLLQLHFIFGALTAVMSFVTIYFRESWGKHWPYYSALTLLFILVNTTGYIGGVLTFD